MEHRRYRLAQRGSGPAGYSLTDRGRELAALLLPLVEWTVVHAEEILGPPDLPDPAAPVALAGP